MAELTLNRNETVGTGGAPTKPLMKGRQTRAAILDAALKLASHMGLEGLSRSFRHSNLNVGFVTRGR